jgi:hypothetical protein
MADRFGKYFTNVLSANRDKAAPGSRFNATPQVQNEAILLDDANGATAIGTTIAIGSLRIGDVPRQFRVASTVIIAGLTASIGTKAAPTKYVNAQAVAAAANTWVVFDIFDNPELVLNEELYLTTGGAALPLAANQKLLTEVHFAAN